MWKDQISKFKNYLKLERSLSLNTQKGYVSDLEKLKFYIESNEMQLSPFIINEDDIRKFLLAVHTDGIENTSQARLISSLRAFFQFLKLDDMISANPMDIIDSPKVTRKIPDVLTYEEIVAILQTIDISTSHGLRNRAMLETLYASGLRVSELINLTFDDFHPLDGFLRVMGKGSKQRLVPIGEDAIKYIQQYIDGPRAQLKIDAKNAKFIFLNKNSKSISRVFVFMVIKEAAIKAGIEKNISPHTFRHSFATHLIEGGANLKAVQDMLGHESITTTEIYTHLDNDYLRETLMQYHPMMKKN
jgi:integrase/recombinase XerD